MAMSRRTLTYPQRFLSLALMGKDDECEGAGLGPTLEGVNGPGKAFSSDDRGDCGERGVFMGDGSVATDGRRHSPYYVAFLSLSLLSFAFDECVCVLSTPAKT